MNALLECTDCRITIGEVTYTEHALEQMRKRNFSTADVEQAIDAHTRGTYVPPARDRMEHYGYASDGRFINVITNRLRTIVISVVEQ